MAQNSQSKHLEEEISLLDCLLFLRRTWKISTIFALIGLTTAVIYLMKAPIKYLAIAQIQIAQIVTSGYNNINPLSANVEEPNMLILRMSLPSIFNPETINACGLDGIKSAGSILGNSIKLSQPKGVASIVELKVIASNPEVAQQCANMVFEIIKTSQSRIISGYIADINAKLANNYAQLVSANSFLSKLNKSESSIQYLSNLNDVRHLLNNIESLRYAIASNADSQTRLVAPIYVSEPILPKKLDALAVGLFGGLLFGLLIAFGHQQISKVKLHAVSNTQSQ